MIFSNGKNFEWACTLSKWPLVTDSRLRDETFETRKHASASGLDLLQVDLSQATNTLFEVIFDPKQILIVSRIFKKAFWGSRCYDVTAKTDVTHLIKVDHCGVLCFQNIDFDSDMARAKYLLILSGTCVARKKQITPVLSVKSIRWATENTLKTKKYIRPLKKVEIRGLWKDSEICH